MEEEKIEEETLVSAKAVAAAAARAAQVAAEAITVAKDVAMRAAETTSKLAETANKTHETVLLLGNNVEHIQKDITEIKLLLDNKYVTKEEFKALSDLSKDTRRIVYGFCAIVLTAFIVAIVTLVLK